LIVCCTLASIVVGAVGIGVDKKKMLAIAVTSVASALVAFVFVWPWLLSLIIYYFLLTIDYFYPRSPHEIGKTIISQGKSAKSAVSIKSGRTIMNEWLKRIIILAFVYGLLLLVPAFFGVLISYTAQPGGISQYNALEPDSAA